MQWEPVVPSEVIRLVKRPPKKQGVEEAARKWLDTYERNPAAPSLTHPLSVCTAFIAGVHMLAYHKIRSIQNQNKNAIEDKHLFAQYQPLLNRLLRARRRIVADCIKDLLGNQITAKDFAREVVCPLLCRTWLPDLALGPGMEDPGYGREVFDSMICGDIKPIVSVVETARKAESLAGVLVWLRDTAEKRGEYAENWRNTYKYLNAAWEVSRTFRGGLPVCAPVMAAWTLPDWDIGYISDALILPELAIIPEDRTPFRQANGLKAASLLPAWQAVQAAKNDDGEKNDGGELKLGELAFSDVTVVVGDYPGGGKPIANPEGNSAGLALAVGLFSYLTNQGVKPNYLATAAITKEGKVGPVGSLPQKGQAVALFSRYYDVLIEKASRADSTASTNGESTPAPERITVLVANSANEIALKQGIDALAGNVEVKIVATLEEAVGFMLERIYDDLLDRQIEESTTALKLLCLP